MRPTAGVRGFRRRREPGGRLLRWSAVVLFSAASAGATLALALREVDRTELSRLAAQRASAALGRPASLGRVEFSFWPAGLRLRELAVDGAPGEPPLLRADDAALGLALMPLLIGRVELRSLELRAPRLELPTGPPALLELLGSARDGRSSLRIERFSVSDGEAVIGGWTLRGLSGRGSTDSRGELRASGSATLEGIGPIEIQELHAAAPRVQLRAALRSAQLAGLLRGRADAWIEAEPAPTGSVDAELFAEWVSGELRSLQAQLGARELQLRGPAFALSGEARAELALGQQFTLDLSAAQLSLPGLLHKPAAETLRLAGELGPELSPAAAGRAVLAAGSWEQPLVLQLGASPPSVALERTEIDLAQLPPWFAAAAGELQGRVRTEELRIALAPLALEGALELERMSLPWQGQQLLLSGSAHSEGSRWSGEALALEVAGQPLELAAAYALETGELELRARARGVDAGPLLAALRPSPRVSGVLDAELELRGPLRAGPLLGSGEFTLVQGSLGAPEPAPASDGAAAPASEATPAAQERGTDELAAEELPVAAPAPQTAPIAHSERRFERFAGHFQVEAGGLRLESFSVRGGEGQLGPWTLRQLDADGALDPAGALTAELSAQLEGVGRIGPARLRAAALGEPGGALELEGTLAAGELGALLAHSPAAPQLSGVRGELSGPFHVQLVGDELRGMRAALRVRGLALRAGPLEFSGEAALQLGENERFELDLGPAQLVWPGVLRKPPGARLALAGSLPLAAGGEPAAERELQLRLGRSQLPLAFALQSETPHLEIGAGALDLAELRDWFSKEDAAALGGRVRSEGLLLRLSPLRAEGALELEAASLPIPGWPAALSGTVSARGSLLASEGLRAQIGGQTVSFAGQYDLSSGSAQASARAQAVDLEKLGRALLGSTPPLGGTLSGQFEWSGPLALGELRGSGEFTLAGGRVAGFSPVRQFLAQFEDLGLRAAHWGSLDLARFEEEEFQQLSGRFALLPGRIDLDSLRLRYRHGSLNLQGSIGLPEADLLLDGELSLAPELERQLAGTAAEGGTPAPISLQGLGGTLARPRLVLDRRTLAQLAERYAATPGRARPAPAARAPEPPQPVSSRPPTAPEPEPASPAAPVPEPPRAKPRRR